MVVAVAEVLAAPRVAGGGVGELAAAAERRRGLCRACAVAGRLVGCLGLMLLGLLGLCGCCGVQLEVGPCAVCLILHQIPGSIEVVVELDVVHGGGQA